MADGKMCHYMGALITLTDVFKNLFCIKYASVCNMINVNVIMFMNLYVAM